MKKTITLTFVALLAMIGLKAQATMYLVGDCFNGWNTTGNVEMTDDGDGMYSWSGNLVAGSSFAFFRDTEDWGSQRGPANGDGSAPTGDWEDTQAMGAWTLTVSGGYVIQYNYNTDQAKITLTDEPVFNPAQRRFAVTGAAFGGWNMPPAGNQIFANNGDGTYTLEFEGATAADFKLSSIDANSDFSSWTVFDSGVMGASNLASGDNALSTSYGTANMHLPVSGNVTLTISNVTETSCTLNITLTEEIIPDKAYYLIGAFNEWSEETMVPFEENDSVFTLTQTFGGEFKVKDENGNWWGGGVTLTEENPSVTLVDGGNLVLAEEKEYTLTIQDGVLTVTFPTVNPGTPGDVDGDGVVTSGDITALYNYLLNNDSTGIVNGDVDNDGVITSADVTNIYNILLGN
ncbi:MAG: SusF/SusE family outer membrane protein [Muribaculaceae bacterium]|nr:SusF/SusE family outer membrane protein [Muribaculaceae bacterium]